MVLNTHFRFLFLGDGSLNSFLSFVFGSTTLERYQRSPWRLNWTAWQWHHGLDLATGVLFRESCDLAAFHLRRKASWKSVCSAFVVDTLKKCDCVTAFTYIHGNASSQRGRGKQAIEKKGGKALNRLFTRLNLAPTTFFSCFVFSFTNFEQYV